MTNFFRDMFLLYVLKILIHWQLISKNDLQPAANKTFLVSSNFNAWKTKTALI